MIGFAAYEYLTVEDAELFTVVCLPSAEGKYPVVICRSPYVDVMQEKSEDEIAAYYLSEHQTFLENGFAVINQHCRGRGKSTGDCIPYIFEREDGIALQSWIREQIFYNGELYLLGGSYTASVHLVTAPFAKDIKGALLSVQDSERYNCNYRNGFYKVGLHGGWYVDMYKKKRGLAKNYTADSYRMLPLSDFSKTVFGENAEDFDEILRHPDKDDSFWYTTRFGGSEAHDAVKHADIPILFTTGFYDIYTGGIFDMWHGLDEQTRKKCALAVNPYDHGGVPSSTSGSFPNGVLGDAFGNYPLLWFKHIRDGEKSPFPLGKITYYELWSNHWCEKSTLDAPKENITFPLGEGKCTYLYDPHKPAAFRGGLCLNFGGAAYQNPPNERDDVITVYTPAFASDTVVNGKMSARLTVQSDCEDTCFYVRVSLCKEEGDYGLRDDIQKISNFDKNYTPGDTVTITFSFDEHAFLIQKGEKLRVDISSSAFPLFVPHTNMRGLFSEQKTTRVAKNTVILDSSELTVFVE